METQKRTFREQGDHERARQRKQPPLARENGLGPCQVRIETETPCPYPATMKIRDVPFCEQCALKQEAYFTIGELTQSQAVDEESLAKALEGMRWERRIGEASGAGEERSATCGRRTVLGKLDNAARAETIGGRR
jgi:hypothetical protein